MTESLALTATQNITYPSIMVTPAGDSDNYTATTLIYTPFHPWSSPMPSVGKFTFGISEDCDGQLFHLWGSVMGLGIVLERVVLVEPNESEVFIDEQILRLTRSELIEYCQVDKDMPDPDPEVGSQAFGLWEHGAGYPMYVKGRVVEVLKNALVFMVSQPSDAKLL